MGRVEVNSDAPDFTLEDWQGNPVTLSHFEGEKHVIIVLNRGFL